MKKFKIFISVFTIVFCCVMCIGCSSNNNSNNNNNQGKTIKISDNLPELNMSFLGMGELEQVSSSNVDVDSNAQDFNQRYKKFATEYYKSKEGDKELHVSHYENSNNSNLEEFTRAKYFDTNISYSNYRMGKSEVYALSNNDIVDGYYVEMVKASSNRCYVCQRSTYSDGNNFATVTYLYPCDNINIEGTNIHLNIPIAKEATVNDNVYGKNSKRFSYDKKCELPSITYYTTKKSAYEALSSFSCSYKATTEHYNVYGHDCGIARELDVTIDGENYNLYTIFIPIADNKTIGIEFREPSGSKTYAFNALMNGISIG